MPLASSATGLLKSLAGGVYAPVYFLQGPEVYYINKIVAWVEKNVLSEEERPFNLHVYYGKDISLAELLSYARSFPMLGQRQVVLVKEAQEMVELQRASGHGPLEAYVEDANAKTLLLFAYKGKSLTASSRLYKALLAHGVVLTTRQVSERDLGDWIVRHLAGEGYKITPEAILLLESLIGAQLPNLVQHLQKICLNLASGHMITHEMVAEHVGMQKDLSIFDLQNALGVQDFAKAVTILDYFMLQPKRYPLPALVNLLTTYFSKLLALRQMGRLPSQRVAKELGLHPYFLKGYARAAQRYSTDDLLRFLSALHEADLQYKGIEGTSLDDATILRQLATTLMVPTARK